MSQNTLTSYSTTDIVIAATLKSQGHRLVDVRLDGQRGTFVFSNIPETTIQDFNFGNLRVEPSNFHTCVKQLSAIIRRRVAAAEAI